MISYKHLPGNLSTLARRLAYQLPAWITLLLVAAALARSIGLALGSLPAWMIAVLDRLSSISAVFLGIVIEAAPFLLIGTLASGMVETFIDREDLARWLPRAPLPAALAGSLIGLFFPVCECGVVPFARRLIHKGVPAPVAIAALLAVPVLNPVVIASTLAAFGFGPIFWGRIALTLAVAVTASVVFSAYIRPEVLLRELPIQSQAQPLLNQETMAGISPRLELSFVKPSLRTRLRRALRIAVDEFFEMSRFLILGAGLAALMQTFIRQAELLAVGQGAVTSVLVMLALAVLLSVCSTVDAFIALAFTGTFTGGAVLAFLVFGPMVDIKSALMFLRVFKPRVVAALVVIPLLLTLLGAVFSNIFGFGG